MVGTIFNLALQIKFLMVGTIFNLAKVNTVCMFTASLSLSLSRIASDSLAYIESITDAANDREKTANNKYC